MKVRPGTSVSRGLPSSWGRITCPQRVHSERALFGYSDKKITVGGQLCAVTLVHGSKNDEREKKHMVKDMPTIKSKKIATKYL